MKLELFGSPLTGSVQSSIALFMYRRAQIRMQLDLAKIILAKQEQWLHAENERQFRQGEYGFFQLTIGISLIKYCSYSFLLNNWITHEMKRRVTDLRESRSSSPQRQNSGKELRKSPLLTDR